MRVVKRIPPYNDDLKATPEIFIWFCFINVNLALSRLIIQRQLAWWYSLESNVLFWQTISLPTHTSVLRWTNFGCEMENRRRRLPRVLYSKANPNFAPWWNDLMNNKWIAISILFYVHNFPLPLIIFSERKRKGFAIDFAIKHHQRFTIMKWK